MKISVEKGEAKGFLPDGRHTVTITRIDEGVSEHQNVPYFAAHMESEDGYVDQRFYNSPAGHPIILSLYAAVGIKPEEGKDLDTKQLIGKTMTIEVGDRSYNDPETGNERTLKQALNFLVS